MKPKIRLDISTFIRCKIYIDRAKMYIGYIQFFMIGIVFIKAFKDNFLGELFFKYVYISVPILFIVFIFFSILFGYLESRLGLKEEELKNLSNSNPILMEILKDIKELKEEKAKQDEIAK